MQDIVAVLASLGHVATSQTLRRRGIRRGDIEAALRAGAITRVRRGWFATAHADADQLRAVALGGRVGCVSALSRWGLWTGGDDDLHIQVAPNAARLRMEAGVRGESSAPMVVSPSIDERLTSVIARRVSAPGEPTVHWNDRVHGADAYDWLVSPRSALAQAVLCQSDEHAIACMDSAIRHGVLSESEVVALLDRLPMRVRSLGRELTPDADSGWESIFITRLRRAGYRVTSQFEVPGVGQFDGLIEGCTVYEVNGLAFHSGPDAVLRDTRRMLAAQATGLSTLAVNPQHIRDEWADTFAAVERVVADALDRTRRARFR